MKKKYSNKGYFLSINLQPCYQKNNFVKFQKKITMFQKRSMILVFLCLIFSLKLEDQDYVINNVKKFFKFKSSDKLLWNYLYNKSKPLLLVKKKKIQKSKQKLNKDTIYVIKRDRWHGMFSNVHYVIIHIIFVLKIIIPHW